MKINWKKTLLIAADIVLGVYLACAFTVLNKPDETARVCTKANIVVADESSNGFIDADEITRRLKASGLYPLGKQMRDINARQIEDKLKGSAFVKTAQCYKTEDGEVNVSITQLLPVIRVKADNGDDYYLDDKDCIMPNSLYTSDLIIATGSIPRWYAKRYISPLGKTIMADDLWKNLIEQINVLPDRSIEIVPRVGNHVVHLGTLPEAATKEARQQLIDEFVKRKLTRLQKFYKYGLSQAGWNKYSYIDIEFDNQIICKKHGDIAREEKAAAAAAEQAPSSVQKQIEQQQATMTTESQPTHTAEAPDTEQKKGEAAKDGTRKADSGKSAGTRKADGKKAGSTRQADSRQAETKKADARQTGTKKSDAKKSDSRQAGTKKTDTGKKSARQTKKDN